MKLTQCLNTDFIHNCETSNISSDHKNVSYFQGIARCVSLVLYDIYSSKISSKI